MQKVLRNSTGLQKEASIDRSGLVAKYQITRQGLMGLSCLILTIGRGGRMGLPPESWIGTVDGPKAETRRRTHSMWHYIRYQQKKTSNQSTNQLLLILPHVFLHHIINTQHRNQILKKEKKIKLATGEKIIQWAGKAYDFQKPIIHLPFNH